MNVRRLFFVLYLAFFVVLGVLMGFFAYNANQEYGRLKAIEFENQRRLDEAESRLKEQQVILERLRTDPSYVEKIIRRNLGYAKPGETVFQFDDGANAP